MNKTSRNRTFIIIGIVSCNLFVWVLAGYFLNQGRQQYEHQAVILSQNIAKAIDQGLSNSIVKVDLALRAVADQLGQQPVEAVRKTPRIDSLLASYEKWIPDIESMRVTDATGVVTYGNRLESQTPVSYADRDFFLFLRDHADAGLRISPPILGRISHKWVIAFARRYSLADGRFGGVVTCAIPLERFGDLLSGFDIGPQGGITLRSVNFAQIARYPKCSSGQVSEIGNTIVSPELRELVRAGVSHATYHTRTPIDNTERMLTFHRLSVAPMIATVGLASEDYLTQWRSDVLVTCLLVGSFLLLSLTSSVVVLRNLNEIEQKGARLLDSNKRLQQLVVVQQHTEDALEKTNALLENFMKSTPDAVYVKDLQGRYLLFNATAEKIVGKSTVEVLGKNDYDLFSPNDALTITEIDRKVIEGRKTQTFEEQVNDAAGREKTFLSTKGLLFDSDGNPIGLFGITRDISDRKQMEEMLRASERRYSALFANKINGIAHCRVITDERGRPVDYWILQVNEAYERIIGIEKADIEGRTVREVFPGVEQYSFDYIGVLGKVGIEGGEIASETFLEATGQYLSIYAYSPTPGEFTAILTDVTERKQSEDELKKFQTLLTASLESQKDTILLSVDRNYRYLYFNKAHLDGMRYMHKRDIELGMNILECLTLEVDKKTGKGNFDRALSGESHTVLSEYGDVEKSYYESNFNPILNENHEIIGASVLSRNITERMQTEKNLKDYAQRLIVLEEDLRNRISMELHDDIGQELTALGLNLAHIGNKLREEAEDEIRSTLEDSRLLTKEITRSVRNLMVDLRPSQLDDYGLTGAIRSYADQYAQRTGLTIALEINPQFPRLSSKTEIALFRITQEALNNVAKYASASKVTISLSSCSAKVGLSITDNGQGFIPHKTSLQPTGSGWGLTIMRERAELIGGSLRLDTEIGVGTAIVVEVSKRC